MAPESAKVVSSERGELLMRILDERIGRREHYLLTTTYGLLQIEGQLRGRKKAVENGDSE